MDHTTLKSLHVLGAVIFLGNIIISAWWKSKADRTRHPQIIAFAQRQITITDFIFTAGGAVLIVSTGDYMAYMFWESSWDVTWIFWGRLFFITSGVLWIVFLIPIQIKQAKMARAFADGSEIPADYWKLGRYWNLIGTVALLLPLANLYWMVFKPA